MKTSWQTEAGHLECRWADLGQQVRRSVPWMHDASEGADRSRVSSMPNFAEHSPLGSGEWFAPWSMRWSLPDRA
jgi:hypothetical protein